MNKVYLVWREENEICNVVKVFDDKKKAQEYLESQVESADYVQYWIVMFPVTK